MRVASFSLKPSPSLFLLLAGLALVACGEDDPLQESPPSSAVGGASGQAGKGGAGGSSSGASGQSGEAGAAGSSAGNGGTAGVAGEAGAAGSAGNASAGQAGGGGQGGAGAGEGGMSGSSGQAGEGGDAGAGGADAGSGGSEAAGEAGAGGSDPVGGSAGAGGSDAGAGGSDAGVGGDAGNGGSDAGSGGSDGGSGGGAGAGGGGNAGGSDGGTGGTAGSGGAGGMSGSSGQGGAGGQAGSAGQGGAGGQATTPTVVAVLGRGLTPASALSFKASGGWTAPQDLNLFVQKTALSSYQGGAVAVARRASKIAAEQDELFWASWSPGAGFGNFAKVGSAGFGIGGPALASIGVAVELTFLGQDFKHYTAQLGESGVWSPFAAFPGGKAGEQAFGPSGAGLASRNVEAWAAYAGDNKTLYVSSKAGPGSSWGFSSAAPTSPVVNTIPPVIRAFDGGVTFAYVLDKNGRIALNTLQLPQNAWSGELTVGDSAITGSDFDFVRLGPDDYLVVWHGLDNDGIYYSRGGGGTWSAPAVVLSPGQPTSAPVVLPGLGDKLAEVLFSAGGTLRHARYDGVGFAVNEVISTSNALSVSATLLSSP